MRESAFTTKIFYRFFFPAVAASVCLGLANLADALCVGMVMGESALAAISLVSPIYMVFNVLHLGMAVGGSVTFAQLMGSGKVKQAVDVFRQMLLLALAVSIALAILGEVFVEPLLLLLGADPSQGEVYVMTSPYAVRLLAAAPLFFLNMLFYYFLRCDDGERRASVGLAVSNLLDVGLSFVFVLGFGMGINGAVYSTIVGVGAAVLIYLPHFFQKANILSLGLNRPNFSVMFQCYRTGFSTSSQYIWQFLFFLVINNLLISRHGESGLAVFNVVLNISYLVVGLFDGVAATIQPLAATFHGERNRQAERDTLHLALKWGGTLGLLLLAAVALFAPQISRLFGLSEDMVGMGTLALRLYCVGGIGAGGSIPLSAYAGSPSARHPRPWCSLSCAPLRYTWPLPSLWPWDRCPISGWSIPPRNTSPWFLWGCGSGSPTKAFKCPAWMRPPSFTVCSSRTPRSCPGCWRSARSSVPCRSQHAADLLCHHGSGGDEPGHLYPCPGVGTQRHLHPDYPLPVGARRVRPPHPGQRHGL